MAVNRICDLLSGGLTDNAGIPLSGGKAYHYAAGTTTLKDLYADVDGTIPAAQPIVLDGAGAANVYGSGNYKFTITDSEGAAVRTIDNYLLGAVVTAPTKITVGSANQVLFTVPTYAPGSDSLRVYLDGVRLSLAAGDYVETSTTSITLNSAYASSISPTSTVLLVEVF